MSFFSFLGTWGKSGDIEMCRSVQVRNAWVYPGIRVLTKAMTGADSGGVSIWYLESLSTKAQDGCPGVFFLFVGGSCDPVDDQRPLSPLYLGLELSCHQSLADLGGVVRDGWQRTSSHSIKPVRGVLDGRFHGIYLAPDCC